MPSLTTPFRRRSPLLWSLLLLAIPAVLLAHARLRRSSPASGERLASSPTALSLWFSERPQLPFTRLRLIGPRGVDVPLGAVSAIGALGITAPLLRPLAAGSYVVVWQTGAADGHVTRGRFGFTVNTAPATAPPAAPGGARPAPTATSRTDRAAAPNEILRVDAGTEPDAAAGQQAATAWVADIALLTEIGAIAFVLVILPALERLGLALPTAADATRRLAQAALVLVFIAMLSRLYVESVLANGARHALDGESLRALLFATTWGNGWLVGAAGAVILLVAMFVAGARPATGWPLAAVGGAALALAPALTGHAVADAAHPALAVAADFVHVVGASIWLGTLLLVALVGIPTILRLEAEARGRTVVALVHAFNPLALGGAALVVVTGVIAASLHLLTVGDLWRTPYGRTLLVKLGAVACVVLIGAYNWRRLTPRLGDADSPRRLRRSAALELLFAAAVLGVTAVLVGTATPEPVASPPSAAAHAP